MVGIAIASQKGGVGKTTITLNLALSLARRGWRTLVIDGDPAGAIGLSLTRRVAEARGLAEYAKRTASLSNLIIRTKLSELAILPAGRVAPEDTMGFQAVLADGALYRYLLREVQPDYDVVLLDTPSGFGGGTLGALRACEHVVCPVQAEPIAARSALRLLDVVGSLRAAGHNVSLAGFLITMVQRGQQSSQAIWDDLQRTLPPQLLFNVHIPRDGAFLEASAAGVPVGLLSRRPPAVSLAFDQLAAELEDRIELTATETQHEPISLVD